MLKNLCLQSSTIIAFSLLTFHTAQGAEDLGLRVAPGFRVSLYADQELANDIYAMTLDSHGRVVVTGPGYIKILHDTNNAGKADRVSTFATPVQGGMGMCFDGNDLYFCGGGWLSRYRDPDGQGRAVGPPERILPIAYAEHGGHAMRKGPDGWWYVIGGNDSKFGKEHATLPHSPIRNPEGGALLRLPPDCRHCEVIAQGFRNPYDFDFNAAGDIFTYDSDCEREFFLPWYTPTRMYHIGHGSHHGWRLAGYLRSWCRRDFYADTVDMLWPVGRGSPTGVTCYRHKRLPEHYQGGIFALDWTFGKVYFFPLQPDGASYRTRAEVFLEAVGSNGFDPTDVVVAPDGALFVCMGGRGTHGAVYRIDYVGEGKSAHAPAASELEAVLHAPQPLDAWSRARWMPLAKKLGAHTFAELLTGETWDVPAQIRAVEVITELFGGLPPDAAKSGAHAKAHLVRARVAWSLGRVPCRDFQDILLKLALDAHPLVRRCALEAWADRFDEIPAGSKAAAVDMLLVNFGYHDKRVRQAAARIASMLPEDCFMQLAVKAASQDLQTQLKAALAELWRVPGASTNDRAISTALHVLRTSHTQELLLQAVRLLMIALGDYSLHNPSYEIYAGYSLAHTLQGRESIVREILPVLRKSFPSTDIHLNEECARLLAMLEDDAPDTVGKVAARWTSTSTPTEDVHYLVVLSRLRGARTPEITTKVAQTLLGLHRKLAGREQRIKQVWEERLAELLRNLLQRDPPLARELLQSAEFVNPGHVVLAAALDPVERLQAAGMFLKAAQRDPDFAWSGPLIDLFRPLPPAEVYPALRAQWSNYGLRDAVLLRLAEKPEPADRKKFLVGLESSEPQVIRASLSALQSLPRDVTPTEMVPIMRLLHRLEQEPKEWALRKQALALLMRQSGATFDVHEGARDTPRLKQAYEPVFRWFDRQYPALVKALHESDGENPAVWERLLRNVDWSGGNPVRGEQLFRTRACHTCHTGSRALGPDLTGVTTRFSRADLFTAIIYPSRDVAPAYRTSVIETRNGQLVTGIVAFESADGLIVQTGAATTVRLATADIVSRLPGSRSLMPDGLLKDLRPADLADLYSYLQTLKLNPARK
jgi:putative membrane-bound dehydrogenase-like protein